MAGAYNSRAEVQHNSADSTVVVCINIEEGIVHPII